MKPSQAASLALLHQDLPIFSPNTTSPSTESHPDCMSYIVTLSTPLRLKQEGWRVGCGGNSAKTNLLNPPAAAPSRRFVGKRKLRKTKMKAAYSLSCGLPCLALIHASSLMLISQATTNFVNPDDSSSSHDCSRKTPRARMLVRAITRFVYFI